MKSMRRPIVRLAASFLLVASAAGATAKPYTALLDPLTADLKARSTELKTQIDPASRIKRELVKEALKSLKAPSKSVADDLKLLTSAARKVEYGYGANDAQLIAALDAYVARVTADRDAAAAKLPTVTSAQSEADARDLLTDATTAIQRVVQRPADLDTVKLRAGVLRAAAKNVASANAKIKRGSVCHPNTFGTLRMQLDSVSERPTFGHASVTRESGSGAVLNVFLQGYFYDRKAADPYERGAYDISIDGAAFQGVGTYAVGPGVTIGRTEHGAYWTAETGTVEVTSYDAAKKTIAGKFEGRLRNVGTDATATITEGFFTYCAWDDLTVTPKR